MLLSRLLSSLLLILLLSGCGFNSLYGVNNGVELSSQLATIKISHIKDRIGQQITNQLLDLLTPLGVPSKPQYKLHVSLEEAKKQYAFKKNAFATRLDLRLSSAFSLYSFGTEQLLTNGKIIAISSYDVVNSDFATLSAEENARSRNIVQISEEIRTRLGIYFTRKSRK